MKTKARDADNAPITLTVTEAARSFSDVVNRALYLNQRFLLTRGGKPVARLAPPTDSPPLLAGELAQRLPDLPRLGAEEASLLAEDLERSRRRPARPEGES